MIHTPATRIFPSLWAAYRHRRRLAVFVIPWVVGLGLGVPLLWHQIVVNAREPQIRNREETLSQAYDILSRTLDRLGRDALFLADLQSRFGDTETPITPLSVEIFQSFASSSPDYDQVRWLDTSGNERLRVNHRGGGEPIVVAEDQLQNKVDRPYFRDTAALPLHGLYFSTLDLNVENGVVEVPHLPTLRVASPVFRNGIKQGIIVINYRATRLLERLKRLDTSVDLYLMNQAGYWIQGPNPEANWAWQLGIPTPDAARAELLRGVSTGNKGLFHTVGGDWSYRRFDPGAGLLITGEVVEMRAPDAGLYLLARDAAGAINSQETRGKLILGMVAAILAVVALAVTGRLANSMEAEAEWARQMEDTNQTLRETNEKLSVTQRELARAERLSSLGLMVAGVAHEMNTPLGSAALVLSKAAKDLRLFKERIATGLRRSDLDLYIADSDVSLDMVRDAIHRCAALVQRFKQVAVDRATLERRDIDLALFIPDADPRLRRWDASAGIGLTLNVPQDVAITTYPGPLAQVLSNLLNNSLLHAFDAGKPGMITINVRKLADQVLIEFTDDGRGINDTDIQKIFEPFFSTARHSGGTGLGLHIVHQIVTEVLGGSIAVESPPDGEVRGTRFIIRLPKSAPAQAET
ncbi:ATP-binding region ATPase domain protein [Rhizobium sp. CF080]|uniref:sensor histidine kinase n=1 Tax=Rhizobium sp. (strain CF080) TaxID=1144310 RepID=UPI000271BD2C|nr:sensor histidine kinase [Rhizobium sp. CF080]EUC00233.1 ATP-binding region ATPase domain protein [Rhizobium sp. CF080]